MLDSLDASRWDDVAKFQQLVVALAAIDWSLRDGNGGSLPSDSGDQKFSSNVRDDSGGSKHTAPPVDGARGTTRSMYHIFRRRATSDHAFMDVVLTAADERSLSDALIQQLSRNDDGLLVLPTLRYTRPARPRAASVVIKPLSSDQLYQNSLFLRQCRATWREAHREVRIRLGHILSHAVVHADKDRKVSTAAGLRALGVRQLAIWAEADAEAMRQAAKDRERAREDRARVTHAGFIKRQYRRLFPFIPTCECHSTSKTCRQESSATLRPTH